MKQMTYEERLATKKGVTPYLLMTFGLAWLIWIGLWRVGYGPGGDTQPK